VVLQQTVELGTGDCVFIKEPVIFLNKPWTEFGGSRCLLDIQPFRFAGEDLAEIGDVAIDGMCAVIGEPNGLGDSLSLQEEEPADLLLVGERRSHVVNRPSSRQQLVMLGLPNADICPLTSDMTCES
jgi:hypothetical protein